MTDRARAQIKGPLGYYEMPALIANCPEHGLHGCRTECFECGKPVEQVPMVPDDTEELREALRRLDEHLDDNTQFTHSDALLAAREKVAALIAFRQEADRG